MKPKPINWSAKAEHFVELAARAAYSAAYAGNDSDREAWEERAARYDARATECRTAARKAA